MTRENDHNSNALGRIISYGRCFWDSRPCKELLGLFKGKGTFVALHADITDGRLRLGRPWGLQGNAFWSIDLEQAEAYLPFLCISKAEGGMNIVVGHYGREYFVFKEEGGKLVEVATLRDYLTMNTNITKIEV